MTDRALPTALLLFIIMSPVVVFLQPAAASTNVTVTSELIEQEVTPSEIMPKNVRVAVYDERNTTEPDYGSGAAISDNGTIMAAFLTGRGFDVTLVDASDITSSILNTARFDVLALPDSQPRENMSNSIMEFWLGGGGVLSIDSAIDFICWTGMLPAESVSDNGRGTYWQYEWSTLQRVAVLHPTTRSYEVGDDLNATYFPWATFDWAALSAVADAGQITRILRASTDANLATGVTYDPSERGGKVVQLPGMGDRIAPDLADVICDSITWLAPVPKARVVFDVSHDPYYDFYHYVNLRDALVSRRFTLDLLRPTSTANLTADRLAPYDILILVIPEYNYTAAERSAVSTWVNNGGSLWIFGENPDVVSFRTLDDHLNQMMQGMGIQIYLSAGQLGDQVYTGLPHVTGEGVTDLEAVSHGWLNVSGTAEALWTYENNILAAVSTIGNGRLFVLPDVNWADVTHIYNADNFAFAMNVADWLSAAGSDILLFTNAAYVVNPYRAPVALALNELGLKYELVIGSGTLNTSLLEDDHGLVVVDSPTYTLPASLFDTMAGYVNAGGRLLMSYWSAHTAADSQLWPLLGFLPLSSSNDENPFYIWDPTHPALNHPVDYGATQFDTSGDYITKGTKLHLFDNATSFAGFASLPTLNESLVAERVDGRTLYVGWLIDGFSTDTDESGFPDHFEFWTNLIAYMMRPTVDAPADEEYQVGATGNTIVWHPSSYAPDSYSITRNGTSVASDPWDGADVQISVDDLAVGHYVYIITVVDWVGHSATNEVVVTVTAVPNWIPGIDNTLLLIIIAAAAVLVVGAVVCSKRRGSSSTPTRSKKKQ